MTDAPKLPPKLPDPIRLVDSRGEKSSIKDLAVLREDCRALVASLELTTPDIYGAIHAVEKVEEIEIVIFPLPRDMPAEISGLCLREDTRYCIWYADHDPWHSTISIAHELGHILGGHISGSAAPGRLLNLDQLEHAEADWGPLYRCHLDSQAEAEAELIGSFIVQRLESKPVTQEAKGLAKLFEVKSARLKKSPRG